MYLCVCVCVCVCVHTHMHTYIPLHLYICTYHISPPRPSCEVRPLAAALPTLFVLYSIPPQAGIQSYSKDIKSQTRASCRRTSANPARNPENNTLALVRSAPCCMWLESNLVYSRCYSSTAFINTRKHLCRCARDMLDDIRDF